MTQYRQVAIQTYRSSGETSSKAIRARPIEGQGLSASMHVECSSKMRTQHPVGTVFVVRAKITSRDGGPEFVYTSWQWPFKIVQLADALDLIASDKLTGYSAKPLAQAA